MALDQIKISPTSLAASNWHRVWMGWIFKCYKKAFDHIWRKTNLLAVGCLDLLNCDYVFMRTVLTNNSILMAWSTHNKEIF